MERAPLHGESPGKERGRKLGLTRFFQGGRFLQTRGPLLEARRMATMVSKLYGTQCKDFMCSSDLTKKPSRNTMLSF